VFREIRFDIKAGVPRFVINVICGDTSVESAADAGMEAVTFPPASYRSSISTER
jgi:hypothetical protein